MLLTAPETSAINQIPLPKCHPTLLRRRSLYIARSTVLSISQFNLPLGPEDPAPMRWRWACEDSVPRFARRFWLGAITPSHSSKFPNVSPSGLDWTGGVVCPVAMEDGGEILQGPPPPTEASDAPLEGQC